MPDVLHFDEATHTYTVGGVALPSVTTILAPLKPDFSAVPPAVLERKRQLGTDVHLACELDDLGELDDSATDFEVMGYVEAWRTFLRHTGARILANERRLYHPLLGYAGTLDRLAVIAGTTWLLDLKTADEPAPVYGPQLSGYELLLRAEGEKALIRRATVHLSADGRHRLHEFKNPHDEAAFRACLALHHWKEATK